jgi:hypothetical protein
MDGSGYCLVRAEKVHIIRRTQIRGQLSQFTPASEARKEQEIFMSCGIGSKWNSKYWNASGSQSDRVRSRHANRKKIGIRIRTITLWHKVCTVYCCLMSYVSVCPSSSLESNTNIVTVFYILLDLCEPNLEPEHGLNQGGLKHSVIIHTFFSPNSNVVILSHSLRPSRRPNLRSINRNHMPQ